jgi:hypothetical protein
VVDGSDLGCGVAFELALNNGRKSEGMSCRAGTVPPVGSWIGKSTLSERRKSELMALLIGEYSFRMYSETSR